VRRTLDWRRWRRRLIAGTMVVTLAALAGVAVFTYLAYQRAAVALVVERDHQVAYLSAARLKDELLKFANELTSLARNPGIYRDTISDQLMALSKASPRLVVFDGGVVLLDRFGRVRATQPERPEILLSDWSDRPFFRELLTSSEVVFSNASTDSTGGRPAVAISVPILDESGGFVGALVGMFGLGESRSSSFYASIIRLRLGQSGNTYVVDGNDRILYDSGYDRIGEMMAVAKLPGSSLQGGAGRMRDAAGNDIVAAHAPVPGTHWTLVTEDNWASVTSSTHQYARILLALLALGIVLPALGIGLLLREQNAAMLERERTEQEARMTNLIQQKLLPKQIPVLPGWSLAVGYQPAQAGRGSLHDFLLLPDGCLMVMIGDVTERGLPAAHLMAMTRATCRGAASRQLSPCEALEYANVLLCPEMAEGQHVSCAYGILDPSSGELRLANAGFCMPVLSINGTGMQLRPPGAPLGIALEARYDQDEVILCPGDTMLLFSEGLINARNTRGETFGSARLTTALERPADGAPQVVESLLAALKDFTGRDMGQSDVTLIMLERSAGDGSRDRSR
jgi:serine phosphatase RsbU (regulator of sigma subunit)